MNSKQFDSIVETQIAECKSILCSKGADYTDGNDRLYNFKVVGSLVDAPPQLVWAIYWLKHVFAIAAFCGRGRLESEPIEGRITDAQNYLYLLRALIEEQRSEAAKAVPVIEDTTARMLAAAGADVIGYSEAA